MSFHERGFRHRGGRGEDINSPWLNLRLPVCLSRRSINHTLFVYKAPLQKIPLYISSLLTYRSTDYRTRNRVVNSGDPYHYWGGPIGLLFFAPYVWNDIQNTLKLEELVPLGQGCPTTFLESYRPVGFHSNPNLAHLTILISWLINWIRLATTGVKRKPTGE